MHALLDKINDSYWCVLRSPALYYYEVFELSNICYVRVDLQLALVVKIFCVKSILFLQDSNDICHIIN